VGKNLAGEKLGRPLLRSEKMMLTVYYDGKCGLCRREIEYYKRVAPADRFVWLDIANDPAGLADLDISQADALRRLHARDASGTIYVGVAAFVAIWQGLDYWRYLALIMKLPFLQPLAALAYDRFADYRFSRLTHCQIALKSAK
jgi:predicted DCC family thiol-disulfide oxidoreductase YuxK